VTLYDLVSQYPFATFLSTLYAYTFCACLCRLSTLHLTKFFVKESYSTTTKFDLLKDFFAPVAACLLDIALVIDCSGSIQEANPPGVNNWQLIVDFIVDMINEINIGKRETHVAAVSFGRPTLSSLRCRTSTRKTALDRESRSSRRRYLLSIKKVKVAHTRLPSVGFRGADPGAWQSACR